MDIDPIEVMKKTKSFAIFGASANENSYGYKLVKNLSEVGYEIFPINPKYQFINEIKCYPNLKELNQMAENIVFALSPANSVKILETTDIPPECYVWFPPECWNEEVINLAKQKNLKIIHDHCPIGTFLKLHNLSQQNKELK